MRKRSFGFTLVEVLVVIVIIGMLSAIIFPVVVKAKGAAVKTSCLSNLKELALASTIYLQDNDERLFLYGYNSDKKFLTWWGDLNTGKAEDGLLWPYTKSIRIRGCPAAENLPTGSPHTYIMGYGVNFRLFYNYPPCPPPIGFVSISSSDVEIPSDTVFMADSIRWDGYAKRIVGTPWLLSDSWMTHLHGRHLGAKTNISWMDGHVSTASPEVPLVDIGFAPNSISPTDMRANDLGQLLKYPRENPYSPTPSIRDQYFFLLKKP